MTPPEVERLTTSDAARRLGVSPSTVRRRIATGHLVAERHPRPQGVRYVVLWDPATASPDTLDHDSSHQAETSDHTVAEIERTAWYWWLLFPAVVVVGMTLGRLLS